MKDCVSRAGMESSKPPMQAAGAILRWDSNSGVCRDVGLHTFSEYGQQSAFQVKEEPTTELRTRPYWTTSEICLVPAFPPQVIEWEKEAARVTFHLASVLLLDTAPEVLPGTTGELVWMHWPEKTESLIPSVHPALIVHAPYESLQAERVQLMPAFTAPDPLLSHVALVLQAAIEGEGVAGHLYAQSLADALVVHFLRRYATAQHAPKEISGGLSLYKLRRTILYIQDHLEQELSLVTLAAVAQTSPAYFARLFKHAIGIAPHQYVLRCRMEQAKRLLTETDMPLSEIGLQVGCADQSHFTALFRKHLSLTPKAYRDSARR